MVGNTVFINAWQDSVQEIERKKKQKGTLFISCRHISTFIDGEDYIKRHGLLPVNDLFTDPKSPINVFLLKNGIRINTKKRTIVFQGKECEIENCLGSNLYIKLYSTLTNENPEREAFAFSGSEKQMLSYSAVGCFPEIVGDIEDYIKERFIRSVDLRGQWNNQRKTVIYEFDVPLTMLNTSGGNQGDDLINEILDCKLQQIEGFSCDEVYVRIDNGYRIDYNDMAKKYI